MTPPKRVRTVCGDIPSEALGYCQCHEHVFIGSGTPAASAPTLCIDDLHKSGRELSAYRTSGGSAIADAQPVGCGRDARALLALSEQTDVHIVASTGFHRLIYYAPSHWIFTWDEERLCELFAREITDGMFETQRAAPPETVLPRCRAGQIKTALEPEGVCGCRRTLFLAAAGAAVRTSAPLMVHVERESDPLALADFFEAHGIAPQKMIFCHMDRTVDSFEAHLSLCKRGAYLEYDTIGRFKYHNNEREAQLIEQVVSAGYVRQLMLSLDTTRQRLVSYGGTIGLSYLLETFLPLLRSRGFSDREILQMQIKNPAAAYAF